MNSNSIKKDLKESFKDVSFTKNETKADSEDNKISKLKSDDDYLTGKNDEFSEPLKSEPLKNEIKENNINNFTLEKSDKTEINENSDAINSDAIINSNKQNSIFKGEESKAKPLNFNFIKKEKTILEIKNKNSSSVDEKNSVEKSIENFIDENENSFLYNKIMNENEKNPEQYKENSPSYSDFNLKEDKSEILLDNKNSDKSNIEEKSESSIESKNKNSENLSVENESSNFTKNSENSENSCELNTPSYDKSNESNQSLKKSDFEDVENKKTLDSKSNPKFIKKFSKTKKSNNNIYNEKIPRKIDSVFDFIELFIFTLATVLIVTTFIFRDSVVDGGSMMNTLQDGEKLILSDLFYDPQQGDIIVCEDYSTNLKKPIVKRVIATEGQTVRVAKEGIYVDGELLDEPYVFTDFQDYEYDTFPKYPHRNNPDFKFVIGHYYEIKVPENEIFVMGDHRNMSTDSRDLGTVKVDSVLGKVVLRIYPFDKFGKVN